MDISALQLKKRREAEERGNKLDELSDEDEEAIMQSISAPQRPPPFNEEQAAVEIRETLTRCRGRPG